MLIVWLGKQWMLFSECIPLKYTETTYPSPLDILLFLGWRSAVVDRRRREGSRGGRGRRTWTINLLFQVSNRSVQVSLVLHVFQGPQYVIGTSPVFKTNHPHQHFPHIEPIHRGFTRSTNLLRHSINGLIDASTLNLPPSSPTFPHLEPSREQFHELNKTLRTLNKWSCQQTHSKLTSFSTTGRSGRSNRWIGSGSYRWSERRTSGRIRIGNLREESFRGESRVRWHWTHQCMRSMSEQEYILVSVGNQVLTELASSMHELVWWESQTNRWMEEYSEHDFDQFSEWSQITWEKSRETGETCQAVALNTN